MSHHVQYKVHVCVHVWLHRTAPKDEDEMMVAIFEYIDCIFNVVRPRCLLCMAIYEVAPLQAKLTSRYQEPQRKAGKFGIQCVCNIHLFACSS